MRGNAEVLAKARGLIRMRDMLCLDRWWSTPELASELGIEVRTAQRWLAEMPQIGCMVSEQQEFGRGWRMRYRGEATYGRLVLR